MKSTTVRVSKEEKKIIREISEKLSVSMTEVINRAIERYRREVFLAEANKAYAQLKENSDEWKEEIKERELWDNTLPDGLEKKQ
ncbi:ribbon-helix-helix protein, CopG family [candidate division WOR-3 bacterium]|nr:ribbon-helix-helix protein, CopG family [candidate division WOR-3 bacterium]MCK4528633.1 ribbon-helix-helix protein, CopG family [candidate division WOR-3 bacterium]